ncbi:MAG: GNAT family protein [bacterium]|nr:GNAT family protein [bacterium]MDA1292770.1 GNAT family protein [bacterium]
MNIPLDTRLTTERLYLRAVSDEDVECVWTASRVPGFIDGMMWDPPETKEEIIEIMHQTIDRWKAGGNYCFSLCLNESNECIGRIVIREKEGDDVWNIGYWLHPDHQGKGYMQEAVTAIVDWGFSVLHAENITAEHASWNEASGKVLLNVGFTHVRHLPCGFIKHGKEIPEEEYIITREEWSRIL